MCVCVFSLLRMSTLVLPSLQGGTVSYNSYQSEDLNLQKNGSRFSILCRTSVARDDADGFLIFFELRRLSLVYLYLLFYFHLYWIDQGTVVFFESRPICTAHNEVENYPEK